MCHTSLNKQAPRGLPRGCTRSTNVACILCILVSLCPLHVHALRILFELGRAREILPNVCHPPHFCSSRPDPHLRAELLLGATMTTNIFALMLLFVSNQLRMSAGLRAYVYLAYVREIARVVVHEIRTRSPRIMSRPGCQTRLD